MAIKQLAESDFNELEKKIEKLLELVKKLKQDNQKLHEVVKNVEMEKNSAIERIDILLDKIDDLL